MSDHAPAPVPPTEDCWSRIGFAGDRSCPELDRLGHCHNCRVFIKASRSLFERAPPDGYAEEWAKAVAQPKVGVFRETESLVIFRLAGELMAFPNRSCEGVTGSLPIHTVPHLTDGVFLGLVNIRGQIQLTFSLAAVLGLDWVAADASMLIALRQRGEVWAFPVEEVLTIQRFDPATVEDPPATLGAAHATFTTGVVPWQGSRVDLLDPDLIVRELARRLG